MKEFKQYMKEHFPDVSDKKVEKMFQRVDKDNSGYITQEEFEQDEKFLKMTKKGKIKVKRVCALSNLSASWFFVVFCV